MRERIWYWGRFIVALLLAGGIVVLVLGMLQGCAYNWRPPVQGWQPMTRVYHFEESVYEVCKSYVQFGALPLACVQFKRDECHIWLPKDPPAWLREHEERHCDGWTHD